MATEAIYPLPRYEETGVVEQGQVEEIVRSVNERLRNVYWALYKFPNEVEGQYKRGSWICKAGWGWVYSYEWKGNGQGLPKTHRDCDEFRLAIVEKTQED